MGRMGAMGLMDGPMAVGAGYGLGATREAMRLAVAG
jgi:hypothetical protein